MKRNSATGVWSVTGKKSWANKPYRYVVKVWAPTVQKVVTNTVTDPYSVALTADSERSLVVDLDAKSLAPSGWSTLEKPAAVALKDAQIQELHIRDFSVGGHHGREPGHLPRLRRQGQRRLQAPREAGQVRHLVRAPAARLRHRHHPREEVRPGDHRLRPRLLRRPTPTSSRSAWRRSPRRTPTTGATTRTTTRFRRARTRPTRTARTVRSSSAQMVKSLNEDGLRVVMDVVYNHTAASGQADTSRARQGRTRLLPAAPRRRQRRQLHLLRQHGDRERHDGQAGGRLDRHLGQGVQGRRLPLRPHGPPPEGQHPGGQEGPRRAHPRPRTASTARRSSCTARAGTSARSPTTPASCRPRRRTWRGPASRPSPTARVTPYAAAAPSTRTPASRASRPASTPTPTPRPATALRPSRRPACCTTRT